MFSILALTSAPVTDLSQAGILVTGGEELHQKYNSNQRAGDIAVQDQGEGMGESTEGGAGQDSSIPLQVPEAAHTGPFPHMGNVGVSLQHILCDHVVAEESLHTGVVPGNVLCLTQIRKSSA